MRKLCLIGIFVILITTGCEKINDNLSGDARDNISTTWTCRETIKGGSQSTYLVDITKSDTQNDVVYLDNLFNLDKKVTATMSGFSLSIPEQSVAGWVISGNGTVASGYNKINLSFTASDGSGEVLSVTAVLTEYPSN
jgi:hypothetical protein